MYSTVRTAVLDGISAIPVQVEVDISTGMPVFDMVGNLTSEVREAKERVKTALHSVGIVLPAKRITVNLSPANIKKTGTGFDLPIAVAILTAMGVIDADSIKDCTLAGELNLNGEILPVSGILPIVFDEYNKGIGKFIIPKQNENEVSAGGAHRLHSCRSGRGAGLCGRGLDLGRVLLARAPRLCHRASGDQARPRVFRACRRGRGHLDRRSGGHQRGRCHGTLSHEGSDAAAHELRRLLPHGYNCRHCPAAARRS